MFELCEIEELANQVNLSILYEIAKNSAQIGNEILKVNYNKIQKISSKGRKGDLVTNVDLEVENKIKEYLLEETPDISINAEESGKLTKSSDLISYHKRLSVVSIIEKGEVASNACLVSEIFT